MSVLLALLIAATPGSAIPPDEEVRSCFGPPIGFEAGSDRFPGNSEQTFAGIVDHMNNRLWSHGWFVLHSTISDARDQRALDLVQRRQSRILNELTRRGIAAARIRFAAPNEEFAGSDYENLMIVESVVPLRFWAQIIPPDVVC